MVWWQWGILIAVAVSFGTWSLHAMLHEVVKATREVRDEIHRLRLTMVELNKQPFERDETIVPREWHG